MNVVSQFVPWIALAAVAFGCGKPTPERACDHAVEVSTYLGREQCLTALRDVQRATPEKYESVARCLGEAKNAGSVAECGLAEAEQRQKAAVGVAATRAEELPAISVPADVDKITIANGGAGEVVLERKDGSWSVAKPTPGAADQAKVDELLSNLRRVRSSAVLVQASDADAVKMHDLDASRAVHVIVWAGGDRKLDIKFGKAGTRGQAAMLDGNPAIYAVSGYTSYQYTRAPTAWAK